MSAQRSTAVLVCLIGLAVAFPLPAQEAASVSGKVFDAAPGEPLAKAVVTLYPHGGIMAEPKKVYSDAEGAFSFRSVEPARYRVTVARPGYVEASYGQGRTDGRLGVLDVPAGAELDDLVFRLTPAGVITGRIVDELGMPLASASVEAMQYRYRDGKRELSSMRQGGTDDRGLYRIWGVPPGRYFVRVSFSNRGSMDGAPELPGGRSYVPIFFPGVADAGQSSPVEATAGVDTLGIDIRMEPQRASSVSGVVVDGATGKPAAMVMLMMFPKGSRSWGPDRPQSFVRNPEGRFEFQGVKPGEYLIHATAAMSQRDRKSGRLAVTVTDNDLAGLRIRLTPGLQFEGVVRVEDDVSLEGKPLFIYLQPKDGATPMMGGTGGPVDSEGVVHFENIAAGEYLVHAGGGFQDAYLKSAKYDGKEVVDEGLVITEGAEPAKLKVLLSPRGGRIAGTVKNNDGEPVVGATTLLVPEGNRDDQRYFKQAATDQNGVFSLRGIRPGNYLLLAWEEIEQGAWQDPLILETYTDDAEKIEIEENDALQVELEAIPADEQ